MPVHNDRGIRRRHGGHEQTRARTTHGGSFDPTGSTMALYGSQMDIDPVTNPDYQGQWGENDIGNDAIGSQHLQALAVLAEALADNAVAQRHLQDQAVGTEEIAFGAVTTDRLYAFAVTADKILAGSVTAEKINAAGLAANQITSGTLSVGGLANTPDIINVYDDNGDLIARFSEEGFLLVDPGDPDAAMRFVNGVLQFTDEYTLGVLANWTTSISASGIVADTIKVGIAPGGHNLIPNSSFENTPFSTNLDNIWPTDSTWATTIGTDVNLSKGGASLELTSAV